MLLAEYVWKVLKSVEEYVDKEESGSEQRSIIATEITKLETDRETQTAELDLSAASFEAPIADLNPRVDYFEHLKQQFGSAFARVSLQTEITRRRAYASCKRVRRGRNTRATDYVVGVKQKSRFSKTFIAGCTNWARMRV